MRRPDRSAIPNLLLALSLLPLSLLPLGGQARLLAQESAVPPFERSVSGKQFLSLVTTLLKASSSEAKRQE